MELFVTVQSANRSENVKILEEKIYPYEPTWFVPKNQEELYKKNGAKKTVGVDGIMPMKPLQLNAALDLGYDYTVTMDDDFQSAVAVTNDKKNFKVSFAEVLENSFEELKKSPYMLAGFPNTTNPFFTRYESQNYGMIFGGFLIHKKNDIRFDNRIIAIEDLDVVIQHHMLYGGILRINRYLPTFHMYGRDKKDYSGGFDKFRNEDSNVKTIQLLRQKYPGIIFEDKGVAQSIHRKIKWKTLKPATATLF